MATVVLKFDLTDPDDKIHFERCQKSLDMALALSEFSRRLRNHVKYGSEGELVTFETVRTEFYGVLNDHKVDIEDLLL